MSIIKVWCAVCRSDLIYKPIYHGTVKVGGFFCLTCCRVYEGSGFVLASGDYSITMREVGRLFNVEIVNSLEDMTYSFRPLATNPSGPKSDADHRRGS